MEEFSGCDVTMPVTTHVKISGILFSASIVLWLVLMVTTSPAGSVDDQLQYLTAHRGLYSLNFCVALCIGPCFVYLLLSYKRCLSMRETLGDEMGKIFLIVYLCCISISYSSQMIYFPQVLDHQSLEAARSWYFSNPHSFPYALNQTGYFIWAVSALILFWGDVRKGGLVTAIAMTVLLSAILSIIAYIGLLLNNESLNMLTVPGGALTLVVGILMTIFGFTHKSSGGGHAQ